MSNDLKRDMFDGNDDRSGQFIGLSNDGHGIHGMLPVVVAYPSAHATCTFKMPLKWLRPKTNRMSVPLWKP